MKVSSEKNGEVDSLCVCVHVLMCALMCVYVVPRDLILWGKWKVNFEVVLFFSDNIFGTLGEVKFFFLFRLE